MTTHVTIEDRTRAMPGGCIGVDVGEGGDGLVTLLGDETAGVRVPEGSARAGTRLHRCQRGNISILVLFMGLVLFALGAATWNTGKLASAKIEVQTAADSAAYSSAVWTSRAVNVITATNMMALRDASALAAATTMGFECTWILGWELVFLATQVIPLLSNPFTLATGLANLAIFTADMGQWASIVAETGWPVLPIWDAIDLGLHLNDLMAYQREWVAAVPLLISLQEQQIEAYYDCDLHLRMGNGSTRITAPLHPGTQLTCLVPFLARFAYDGLLTDSWRDDARIKTTIIKGQAKMGYNIGALIGGIAGWSALGFTHHVLSSQPRFLPFEFGTYGIGLANPLDWADYTVVAVARKRPTNLDSLQHPTRPLELMAPGLFSHAVRPMAYAQAETYNGVDGLLNSLHIPGLSVARNILMSLYPWRVWTDWGWQWQPRLTHGALIDPSVFHPSPFQGPGVTMPSLGRTYLEPVTLH